MHRAKTVVSLASSVAAIVSISVCGCVCVFYFRDKKYCAGGRFVMWGHFAGRH